MDKRSRKVLPIVERMRRNIDALFLQYKGPIMGKTMARDCYNDWMETGSIGPNGLRRYIQLLSNEIPSSSKRKEFKSLAVKQIRIL